MVSTRLPELRTFPHSFQLDIFRFFPVQVNIDLPPEGKQFLLPPAEDVFFNHLAVELKLPSWVSCLGTDIPTNEFGKLGGIL